MRDKAYDRSATTRSRALRNDPTPAEKKLWSRLRNQQLAGVRFNRQVPVDPFICDFVARSEQLIVEVDGGQHAIDEQSDKTRTAFLESKGFRVLRFWNNEVIENLEGVVTTIAQALNIPSPIRAGGEEERSDDGEGRSSSQQNRPSPTPPAGGRGL